jgi:hypothetical protein
MFVQTPGRAAADNDAALSEEDLVVLEARMAALARAVRFHRGDARRPVWIADFRTALAAWAAALGVEQDSPEQSGAE